MKLKSGGMGWLKRELMYVDDLADACVFFMNKKNRTRLYKCWNWETIFNS